MFQSLSRGGAPKIRTSLRHTASSTHEYALQTDWSVGGAISPTRESDSMVTEGKVGRSQQTTLVRDEWRCRVVFYGVFFPRAEQSQCVSRGRFFPFLRFAIQRFPERELRSRGCDNFPRRKTRRNSIAEAWAAPATRTSAEVAWGTAVMELQSWLLYHLVAVTDCNQVMQSAATGGGVYPAGGTGSRARDLGLRAQKKLLGRVASTGAGRSLLIDDATTSLLDNLYKLMERAAKTSCALDKKQPEKVLKNIVKLSIKVGLLQRNRQLGASDDAKLAEIRTALRAVAMAVVSFYELEFSFDRAYLTRSLERCRTAILGLIKPHLTDKSQDRCDQVFDFLTHPEFLNSVFGQDSEHRPALGMLVGDINKAIDAGHL